MRTLIVDDEPIARNLLRELLAEFDFVEVVGECRNAAEALQACQDLAPDLLFLDIEMPGISGIDLPGHAAVQTGTMIVFVTAFEEYAARAFEVEAFDYILKPLSDARVRQVVLRARENARRLKNGAANVEPARPASAQPPRQWLTARRGNKRVPLNPERFEWIEATGNYVKIHSGGKVFLSRSSLRSLLQRLDPQLFVRVHRSAIVNIRHVEFLIPTGHGDFDIRLTTGHTIRMSRRYRSHLEKVLGPFS